MSTILLLTLATPIFLFILASFYGVLFPNAQWNPGGEIRPFSAFFTFYLKDFLVILTVFLATQSDVRRIGKIRAKTAFIDTLIFVSYGSAIVSIIQIVNALTVNSQAFGEIFGMRYGNNFSLSEAGILGTRVQALFIEPRNYGAFLAVSAIVFLRLGKNYLAIMNLIIGFFTQSQTYMIIVAIGLLCLPFYKTKYVRAPVAVVLASIVVISSSVTMYLANNNNFESHSIVESIVIERLASRAALSVEDDTQFLGLPMQADLELPVVRYLSDNPFLLLTGYGFGGSKFLPPYYFIGQRNHEERLRGKGSVGSTMGGVYAASEFGVIFSLIAFYFLSRKVDSTSDGFMATFFWVAFFFSRIDIFLFIYLAILYPSRRRRILYDTGSRSSNASLCHGSTSKNS